MTTPAISIPPEVTLHDAGQIMKEYNIRHLPVVKDGTIVGILSSGDIRRASPSDAVLLSIWEVNYLWQQIRVESAMTARVITVRRDTSLSDAVRLMLEHRFNSLPVVSGSGYLVGMLTEVDIFRLFVQMVEGSTSLVPVS
jgi:acetoin utilization protein AcuB